MGTELILRHASPEQLSQDFETNLRKGRAFVAGSSSLSEREFCTLRIESPNGGEPHRVRAEAVWIDRGPTGGTGLSFVDFDPESQTALRSFVEDAASLGEATHGESSEGEGGSPPSQGEPSSSSSPMARNLHDRIRALDVEARDVLARQGSLPERVALERCYGSAVWEGLLHNPQLTPREVLRMAKSSSLPTTLANTIANNRAWVADAAINQALLANPRMTGAQLEKVLRALPQAEIVRVAEQSSLRIQVRQAAKRLIRR